MVRPRSEAGSAGDRKRVTTFLLPDLWKRVRLHAVTHDLPTWAVVEAAVVEYLDRRERTGKGGGIV